MMLSYRHEDIGEDIGDLDICEGECLGFHAQYDMLHLQGERLFIYSELRSSTSLDHEFTGFVPVKLGDCPEEIDEIASVRCVEGRNQTRVDEDELRFVSLRVELLEAGNPSFIIIRDGGEGVDELVGRGRLCGNRCFRLRSGEAGEEWADVVGCGGFEEADHDVATAVSQDQDVHSRVKIAMCPIVEKKHFLTLALTI